VSAITSRIASTLFAGAVALGTTACMDPDSSTSTSSEEIIGGVPANSAKLNGIGALGWKQPDGSYRPICTGTLIKPTIVLTAEHCVNFATDPANQLAFLIGPNAWAPISAVPVRGVAWEDTVTGGVIDLGVDVAVMHLAQPVTTVPIFPYAELTASKVGQTFTGIGYGVQDNQQTYGTRRAGNMQMQALGGRVYEAIYDTFQNFLDDDARYGLDHTQPGILELFQQAWDETLLLSGEGWFGNGCHDAQACNGDSGGPILLSVNGKSTVFGVASWVAYRDENLMCDLGTAYAGLDPVALDFLAYQTKCPLIPREGTCDGDTIAVRCVPPNEGGYYISNTNCDNLGQVCGFDPLAGEVGCVDDPCEGLPAEGTCDGAVLTRCSLPGEGPRHVVVEDCGATGGTCEVDASGVAACAGGSTCSHGVCEQGPPLDETCDSCTANVCGVDPYCCDVQWDSICVDEAQQLCGATCGVSGSSDSIGVQGYSRAIE
jgi:hypothetical protein